MFAASKGVFDPYALVSAGESISGWSTVYAITMYFRTNGTIEFTGSHTGSGGAVTLSTTRWYPEGLTPPPIYISRDITAQDGGQPESDSFPGSPTLLTGDVSMSAGGNVVGNIYLRRTSGGPAIALFPFQLDYY